MKQINHEYERGFIDGMQKQAQSSVDKAVNRLCINNFNGYTPEELEGVRKMHDEGRCMPFIEFRLANGLIIRFLSEGSYYRCSLRPQEATNFLTGEWR